MQKGLEPITPALNLFVSLRGEVGLFNLNFCTGLLESSFELLGLSLGNFFLQSCGSLVNDFLSLLKSETKSLLDGLDYLKLSLSGAGENNVEFGLLLLLSLCCSGNGASYCYCSCCRLDTILFLENLCKFLNVFYSEVYQLLCKCFYVCHDKLYFLKLLILFLLSFLLGKCFDQSSDCRATSVLESGDDVACRRLEESDDLADEFFLALDGRELFDLVSTYESTLLNIGTLEGGFVKLGLLGELFDEFCGSVGNLSVHDSAVAFENLGDLIQFGIVDLFDHVIEKGVLDYFELDSLFEASAAELGCLFSIQAGDVGNVEVGGLLELC